MRSFETEQGYIVRLDLGEEVLTTLTRFITEAGIQGGAIRGIGAVVKTTLGYFDLHAKTYDKRDYPGDMELVSCDGNITWLDGAPMVHAHATISGPDYVAQAGHLFSAEIAVTGEFYITTTSLKIKRAPDDRTGLNLIDG
jgi:predicted DNA-binding protein with PD1-like motif